MPNQLELENDAARWKRILDTIIRVLVLMLTATVALTLYFTLVVANQIQVLGQQNKGLNEAMLKNTERLIDCTTPGYPCFDEGQRRTGQAVVSLNEVTKAATVCADRPGSMTYTEMEACIKTELNKFK